MADVKLEARAKSQKALTFTIPAAEIESEYGNKIAKYAKELTLKGFRKGKAPLSVSRRSSMRIQRHLQKATSRFPTPLSRLRMRILFARSKRTATSL